MKFISDSFKSNRGGYSRFYQIFCRKCKSQICIYQKDGPGNLRRMYIDRIIDADIPVTKREFVCKEGHVLGSKMNFEKENRQAFRLYVDAVTKKLTDSKKI